MERVIEVFVELDGTSQFVGRLWSRSLRGRESASFEYDKKWIASDARFALEPLLTIDTGIHHSQPDEIRAYERLVSKVSSRTWKRSVPPAVAGGCVAMRRRSITLLNQLLRILLRWQHRPA